MKDFEVPRSDLLYKIISQRFSRPDKKQILVIEQHNQPELIMTFAQKISNDPDMLDGFSPRDAHQIGFAAGMASVLEERWLGEPNEKIYS